MTSLIATLPLQIVCQLLVMGNLTVTENVTSDGGEPLEQTRPPLAVFSENYDSFSAPPLRSTYKIHNESRSWNEARKICISEGSHLAVIDSWEKYEIVKGMRTVKLALFIGIHNMFNRGEWVRADNGFPVTSVPWLAGTPNNNGNCLALYYSGEGVGDTNCNWAYPFVCEIPMNIN